MLWPWFPGRVGLTVYSVAVQWATNEEVLHNNVPGLVDSVATTKDLRGFGRPRGRLDVLWKWMGHILGVVAVALRGRE